MEKPQGDLTALNGQIAAAEDGPPPCDAPHLTPRAVPSGITGQPSGNLKLPGADSNFIGFRISAGDRESVVRERADHHFRGRYRFRYREDNVFHGLLQAISTPP
ncbi:hypothetical protein GCM10018966_069740 [Streptomyces yanii]